MSIFNHYLLEDHDQLADHLEVLHNSANKIITAATTADFVDTQKQLDEIKNSIDEMMALHLRKRKHEGSAVNHNEVVE